MNTAGNNSMPPVCDFVTAVISTHNRCGPLRETLALLASLGDEQPAVLIVDNGSRDETAAMIRAQFPKAELLIRSENHPIRGYNAGFEQVKTPYIWVMDDDAAPAAGTLRAMVALLERQPDVAAAAGNILRSKGDSEWEPLPTPAFSLRWYNLIGCGFLIRTGCLKEIGGYCEHYDLYYNDLELALRLLARGHLIAFSRSWIVHHRAAPSATRSSRKNALMLRNFCYVVRAHYRGWTLWNLLLPHTLKFFVSTMQDAGFRIAFSSLRQGLSRALERPYIAIRGRRDTGFKAQYALSSMLLNTLTGTHRLQQLSIEDHTA